MHIDYDMWDETPEQRKARKDELEEISKRLAPCPFCGKIPRIRESNDWPPFYGIDHWCGDGWRMCVQLRWKRMPEEVVEEWNRRAGKEDNSAGCN